MCLSECHTGEGAGGCDWKDKSLHSQNMSFTDTSKEKGAVKVNFDCQH